MALPSASQIAGIIGGCYVSIVDAENVTVEIVPAEFKNFPPVRPGAVAENGFPAAADERIAVIPETDRPVSAGRYIGNRQGNRFIPEEFRRCTAADYTAGKVRIGTRAVIGTDCVRQGIIKRPVSDQSPCGKADDGFADRCSLMLADDLALIGGAVRKCRRLPLRSGDGRRRRCRQGFSELDSVCIDVGGTGGIPRPAYR
jgi:hypothetical protein